MLDQRKLPSGLPSHLLDLSDCEGEFRQQRGFQTSVRKNSNRCPVAGGREIVSLREPGTPEFLQYSNTQNQLKTWHLCTKALSVAPV